jgi:plastocyanin
MTQARRVSRARRRAEVIAPLALLSLAIAGVAVAAKGSPAAPPAIHGKLTGWDKLMPQVYVDATRNDARRYTWREPSPTVKQEFRKLSADVARDVCIVALGSGAATAHDPVAIKVTGGRFTPSTIVLSPGSRLSFKNVDPFEHTLYENGNDAWAPNPVAPGSSREWSSSAPGVHVIRDQLFPSVVMYVVVDPSALEYTLPDHDGAFALTVPSGDYTLKAFFDGKAVGKESVHVGPTGLEMKEPMVVGGGDSK